jgi:putative acetyltransferase
MEHVLIVEMPGRSMRGQSPGALLAPVKLRATDLDGFRVISLSPARSADRAWRPADSVRVVEVTIRTYERRDAVGVADVFYRSVREVALSDYTPQQVRAWVPGRWDAGREHRRSGDGRLVLVAAGEPGHVVASRLYDAIEAAARAQGIQRLFTEASELARRFFERKGFTVLERQDMILRGVPIHNYRMAKTLG